MSVKCEAKITMNVLRLAAMAVSGIGPLLAVAQTAADREVDLFGVYAPPIYQSMPPVIEPDEYPFTPDAAEFFETYDPIIQDARSTDDCAAEKIPGVLWDNGHMEFVRGEGGTILMRFERLGTTRTINMDSAGPPAGHLNSDLGYSAGRWENGVLIIETTLTAGGVLRNLRGHPVSESARLTERYWREPGQMNLKMELVVEDPANYTDSVTLGREWVWAPEEDIQPWNCVSLGPKDTAPDLDELTRMLEGL